MLDENCFCSHIGWAVPSIDSALPSFGLLGFFARGQVYADTERKVSLLILKDSKGNTIELVEPLGVDSPVTNLLAKNGAMTYHVCFSTKRDSWDEYKKELQKEGFVPLSSPSAAPALGGYDVVFLYSKKIGLIEIIFDR